MKENKAIESLKPKENKGIESLKPFMSDDVRLDLLLLIEETRLIEAYKLIKEHAGLDIQRSAQLIKKIAKEEFNKDILTNYP